MAQRREVSLEEGTNSFGMKLSVPKDEIAAALKDGGKLVMEESEFSDPGDDYSALYLFRAPADDTSCGGERVGFCAGY